MIRTRCPKCGTRLSYPDAYGKRRLRCPRCAGRLPMKKFKEVEDDFPFLRNGLLLAGACATYVVAVVILVRSIL